MMLNKRENTPIVPREEERKSKQTRINFSVERTKKDNGQDRMISNLVLQIWMEKDMIGMRQLPIVLKVCVNAALKSFAQTIESTSRSKCCSSRPLFAKKGSNPVSQTDQDYHHSTLSRNGKGEERGQILESEVRNTQSNGQE